MDSAGTRSTAEGWRVDVIGDGGIGVDPILRSNCLTGRVERPPPPLPGPRSPLRLGDLGSYESVASKSAVSCGDQRVVRSLAHRSTGHDSLDVWLSNRITGS